MEGIIGQRISTPVVNLDPCLFHHCIVDIAFSVLYENISKHKSHIVLKKKLRRG